MKEEFAHWKPNSNSRARLETISKIIDEYTNDGITLTLRQLYYQLVSKALIPNTVREYKNLGALLSKARLAGLVDWDAIEDRGRTPTVWKSHETIQDCVQEAARGFTLPRWKDQPRYVELWCEKQALSSVIEPICSELFANFMVNKGYSSSSAMYEARNRITENADGRDTTILYLGDFDPSGEDMVRDIRDRLDVFQTADVEVIKLALNPDQIKKWKLPPNPAKLSDSRSGRFIDRHGSKSYEVDAIPPKDLQKMIRSAITRRMDMKKYARVLVKENKLTEKLMEAVEGIE